MKADKIAQFMQLAGQNVSTSYREGSEDERKLGAQLLLSEVLEYVIHGLGVVPEFNGTAISDPNALVYNSSSEPADQLEMLDGLADVAYTMFWNALAFGLPLEEAFELVCDNNLEKFVLLENWSGTTGALEESDWHCQREVSWPAEVVAVEVLLVGAQYFAVGKDSNGKVRKPSHYSSVDLGNLLSQARKVANG